MSNDIIWTYHKNSHQQRSSTSNCISNEQMKLRPDFGILTKQYKLPAWQQKVIEGTIICTLSKKKPKDKATQECFLKPLNVRQILNFQSS